MPPELGFVKSPMFVRGAINFATFFKSTHSNSIREKTGERGDY